MSNMRAVQPTVSMTTVAMEYPTITITGYLSHTHTLFLSLSVSLSSKKGKDIKTQNNALRSICQNGYWRQGTVTAAIACGWCGWL